jgi:xylan 1,4-beta-xylosidase
LSLSYADTAFALGPEWSALVTATVRRYSQEKNISGIYYEVWNEPDLFGGWHYAKHPSYSTLYTQTAKAVVAGAPARNYKIGGPAITGYYSNWIKALFRLAAAHHLPLDFISWHRYSKIPQDYDRDFDSLNKILSDYPQYFDIERLVTEIGPNSEPDPWYDNRNSGIHLISLATRLSGKVHRLFTFEIIDGPNPRSSNSTGWGLITHDLKPKPRYFALQFLNQLKGQRLASSGDGSWVTSLSAKNGTAIQILLVNYDPRAAHHETVPVSLFNLTPGRYQLSTSTYLGHSSTRQITISAPIYRFDYYLDPNAAVLFEFKPI